MTTIDEDSLNLVNLLDTILERVVTKFGERGIDIPARQYWTLSTPAADCEQLVVFFNQAYIGPPGDEASEPQRCNSPRTAQIDIQLLRCIPTPLGPRARTPEAAAIQAAAKTQAIDAWTLLDMSCELDNWDEYGGPGLGVIATVDAGDPQGGYQGVTLHLTVAIP